MVAANAQPYRAGSVIGNSPNRLVVMPTGRPTTVSKVSSVLVRRVTQAS